jgi:hypothetical protein
MTLLDRVKELDDTQKVDGWDRVMDFFFGWFLGVVMVAIVWSMSV